MKKQCVAVNLLWVRHNQVGGTEVFARNLLDGFSSLDEDYSLVLIVSKDNEESFRYYADNDSRFKLLCANIESANISKRIIWQNLFLNSFLKKNGLKYCFSPVYDRPYFNGGIHYINVIHDIQAIHYPEYHPFHEVAYSKMIWHADKKSDAVITTTHHVANDIQRYYRFRKEQIHTIYIPVIIGEKDFVDFEIIEDKYGVTENRYYYTVCQMIPHKNVETLLRVFKKIVDEEIDLPKKLLVSGISGNATKQIVSGIRDMGLEDHVILTGFVEDKVRNTLYRYSRAFLFPSVFEGFGIPPIEAMMCGGTVITTKCTSIPEVTQNSAVYVDDPYDEAEWVETMRRTKHKSHDIDRSKYDRHDIAEKYLQLFRCVWAKQHGET